MYGVGGIRAFTKKAMLLIAFGAFVILLLVFIVFQRVYEDQSTADAQARLLRWAQVLGVQLISASPTSSDAPVRILGQFAEYHPELSVALQDVRGDIVVVQGRVRRFLKAPGGRQVFKQWLRDAGAEQKLVFAVATSGGVDLRQSYYVYQTPLVIAGSSYKLTLLLPQAQDGQQSFILLLLFAAVLSLILALVWHVFAQKMLTRVLAENRNIPTVGGDSALDTRHDFRRTLSTSQTDLIANVSHDLRTPLTSILGYSETLLLKDETIEPKKRVRLLGIIRDNTQVLIDLVNEVFDLSRLDAGLTVPEMEPILVRRLFDQILHTFQPFAEERDVSLAVDPGNAAFIEGDASLLYRAISNLVQNAINYTPEGGSVVVQASAEGEQVRISVIDTGIGIPEEKLAFIFERFFRVNQDRARKTGGAGLGLAISLRIIEAHGSIIDVSSIAGEGTTMSFVLSVAKDMPQELLESEATE